ncbi:hypothetical protein GQX74_006943 [Glossina fuscipes]|nr:hypothetical protein GQX74_006943 [Glossina fuscipes]
MSDKYRRACCTQLSFLPLPASTTSSESLLPKININKNVQNMVVTLLLLKEKFVKVFATSASSVKQSLLHAPRLQGLLYKLLANTQTLIALFATGTTIFFVPPCSKFAEPKDVELSLHGLVAFKIILTTPSKGGINFKTCSANRKKTSVGYDCFLVLFIKVLAFVYSRCDLLSVYDCTLHVITYSRLIRNSRSFNEPTNIRSALRDFY